MLFEFQNQYGNCWSVIARKLNRYDIFHIAPTTRSKIDITACFANRLDILTNLLKNTVVANSLKSLRMLTCWPSWLPAKSLTLNP